MRSLTAFELFHEAEAKRLMDKGLKLKPGVVEMRAVERWRDMKADAKLKWEQLEESQHMGMITPFGVIRALPPWERDLLFSAGAAYSTGQNLRVDGGITRSV